MGLLQDIVQREMGGPPADPQQQQNLLAGVTGLLNHPQVGGIGGLMKLFEAQGLGHLMSAWIGNGPNPPVSANQLEQVLGSQRIRKFAQEVGIDPNEASSKLAAILPHAIDHLTPSGTVPPAGVMSAQSMFEALKSKFMNA
jgi:uncharacterized protein YidB (DUF937 family)